MVTLGLLITCSGAVGLRLLPIVIDTLACLLFTFLLECFVLLVGLFWYILHWGGLGGTSVWVGCLCL